MNDLLGDVTDKNPFSNGKAAEQEADKADEEQGAVAPISNNDKDMQQFFHAVDAIKMDMVQIRTLQKELLDLHSKGKTIIKTQELQRQREAMQDKINQINKIAHGAKGRIEALDRANEAARKKEGQGEGSASERMRTTITAGLKAKLKDLMGEFSELRMRMQAEYRDVVEQRVYTVTGEHATEQELDSLVETGEGETLFQKAITEQGRGRVMDTLAEIQERHRAVKDLEQSLLELHQIFLDMAVLVEAQGEMLDNIEKQVARASDAVVVGTVDIQQAKSIQKNTRKWMCFGIMVVLVIVAVIVLSVVLKEVL